MSRGTDPIRQDYIARIRYSNVLPPPPIPPKLLDIPNTGLSGGLYTSPSFSSRMAREQPLNIEADAELGMPIDLVGLPGVFDGNEAAILALDNPPKPHPADLPLLRPLASIGKPTANSNAHSFLRRTEYISSSQGALRFDSSTSKDLIKDRKPRRKRAEQNDHISIARAILKGFDLAYPADAYKGPDGVDNKFRGAEPTHEEKQAWLNPKHPSNGSAKLVDKYPLIPDLGGYPELVGYTTIKFAQNPGKMGREADPRVDVGLLYALEADRPEYTNQYERAKEEHEIDPSKPEPFPYYDYDFFMPKTDTPEETARGIKRKIDPLDAEADEADAYYDMKNASGKHVFRYERVRKYETTQQTGDVADWFADSVAIALHDGPQHNATAQETVLLEARDGKRRKLQKAAYFYPITARIQIRPSRDTIINKSKGITQQDDGSANKLDLSVRERNEEDNETRTDALRTRFGDASVVDQE